MTTPTNDLHADLTKLAEDFYARARALLDAHPAPAPVSDTRREDVAKALFEHDQKAWPPAPRPWRVRAWENVGRAEHDEYLGRADAVLAALPAPPVVDETVETAYAWSDYRKDYGVSADDRVRDLEHKAFMAGRQSARGKLDAGGVQR
jgi:hypothetical protein